MLRSPGGVMLKPDIIMFNWGLHDGPLGNATVPGQAGLPDVYAPQLEIITQMLMNLQPQASEEVACYLWVTWAILFLFLFLFLFLLLLLLLLLAFNYSFVLVPSSSY
jgi:hypothetical protein